MMGNSYLNRYHHSWHLSDGGFLNRGTGKNTDGRYDNRVLNRWHTYGCLMSPAGPGDMLFYSSAGRGHFQKTGTGVWKKKLQKLILSSSPDGVRKNKGQLPAFLADWVGIRYQPCGR